MNIAILVPILRGTSGGLIKHLTSIVQRMQKEKDITNITVVIPKQFAVAFSQLNVQFHLVSRYDYFFGFKEMGKFVNSNNYDVALTLTARSIRNLDIPIVTLAQNIEPFQKPNYYIPFLYRLRLLIIKHEHKAACKQASKIIAISNTMKQRLQQILKIPDDKVEVVYHGYNSKDHRISRKPKLNIPDNFFFAPGILSWYRGLEDIIKAVALNKSKHGEAPTIIFLDGSTLFRSSYQLKIKRLIQSLNMTDHVLWLGYLSQEEMTWCFQHASAFIQTSRAESFSNIQVEAMGQGCLCISCDYPLMKEIFMNTALFYPTGDHHALANTINYILHISPKEKDELKSALKERAAFFSWDVATEKTLQTLKNAILQHKISQ